MYVVLFIESDKYSVQLCMLIYIITFHQARCWINFFYMIYGLFCIVFKELKIICINNFVWNATKITVSI